MCLTELKFNEMCLNQKATNWHTTFIYILFIFMNFLFKSFACVYYEMTSCIVLSFASLIFRSKQNSLLYLGKEFISWPTTLSKIYILAYHLSFQSGIPGLDCAVQKNKK